MKTKRLFLLGSMLALFCLSACSKSGEPVGGGGVDTKDPATISHDASPPPPSASDSGPSSDTSKTPCSQNVDCEAGEICDPATGTCKSGGGSPGTVAENTGGASGNDSTGNNGEAAIVATPLKPANGPLVACVVKYTDTAPAPLRSALSCGVSIVTSANYSDSTTSYAFSVLTLNRASECADYGGTLETIASCDGAANATAQAICPAGPDSRPANPEARCQFAIPVAGRKPMETSVSTICRAAFVKVEDQFVIPGCPVPGTVRLDQLQLVSTGGCFVEANQTCRAITVPDETMAKIFKDGCSSMGGKHHEGGCPTANFISSCSVDRCGLGQPTETHHYYSGQWSYGAQTWKNPAYTGNKRMDEWDCCNKQRSVYSKRD